MAKKKGIVKCGVIKGGYVPTKIENIHEHLKEMNRGAGAHSPKKYTRKSKHKKSSFDNL